MLLFGMTAASLAQSGAKRAGYQRQLASANLIAA